MSVLSLAVRGKGKTVHREQRSRLRQSLRGLDSYEICETLKKERREERKTCVLGSVRFYSVFV